MASCAPRPGHNAFHLATHALTSSSVDASNLVARSPPVLLSTCAGAGDSWPSSRRNSHAQRNTKTISALTTTSSRWWLKTSRAFDALDSAAPN
jgi:hypothetical protein